MERLIFIAVAILLVFGPERVPSLGRALGSLMHEFQGALHPPAPASPAPTIPAPAPRRAPSRRKHSRPKKASRKRR